MSVSLATKGVIAGRIEGGSGPGPSIPVPIEDTDFTTDETGEIYIEAISDVAASRPSPDGTTVLPNPEMADSIASVKPRLNVFPGPY